jgi:antitoxin component of MazEF toxin-antitoxin module
MANNKKQNGIPRKITKTGDYTYYVTIPHEYIQKLGWKLKQTVAVKLSEKKIIIEDWKE